METDIAERDSSKEKGPALLIVAGGSSRRMGADKLMLPVPGQGLPLVRHVAGRLLPLASKVVIVANSPQVRDAFQSLTRKTGVAEDGDSPGGLEVLCLPDDEPGNGPLGGLATGLRRIDCWALTVAGDMPFIRSEVARFLIGRTDSCCDAVVPVVGGLPQPLLALYHRRCLVAVERALASGQRRMDSFWSGVHVRLVSAEPLRAFDPDLISFTNVNTPADWEKASALLSPG